jgi:lipoprotein-anchoring transpeptidase ErfK/SrfK
MNARRRVAFAVLAAAFVLAAPVVAGAADLTPLAPPTITAPGESAMVGDWVAVSGVADSGTVDVEIVSASLSTTASVDASGAFSKSVPVPYGPSVISVRASNADTQSVAVLRTVWNLGGPPEYGAYVLVDKSDFFLYVIRWGAVTARFPIAIGMPRAPTKVGTFYLGRPMRGGGGWGVLRMPLRKLKWVRTRVTVHVGRRHVRRWVRRIKFVRTSYFIHGTNDPASIGTWASLGCVRMYNWDVVALAGMTGIEPVVIRQ